MALVLLLSSDFISFSFLYAQVEGQEEPQDLEQAHEDITPDDFDTPESAKQGRLQLLKMRRTTCWTTLLSTRTRSCFARGKSVTQMLSSTACSSS